MELSWEAGGMKLHNSDTVLYNPVMSPVTGQRSPLGHRSAGGRMAEQVWNFCESTGWRRGGFPGEPANAGMRIWQHRLDADMFRGYNPFCAVNILHDRLFLEYDKTDMTTYLNRRGMVFCDGKPLKQVSLYGHMSPSPSPNAS